MSTQALDALAVANARRLDASTVRSELRAGTLTLTDALADPRSGSLTVTRLLLSIPGVGQWRAEQILTDERVSLTRRVRDLTPRQRRVIAAHRLLRGAVA